MSAGIVSRSMVICPPIAQEAPISTTDDSGAVPGRTKRSWLPGASVGELMSGPLARNNAFDSIRLMAALSVIVSHSFFITQGTYDFEPIHWLSHGQTSIGSVAVGVFFVISGLFISASFDRSRSLGNFVLKRVLRIMPAFIVVTGLVVFIMGPLVTLVPISQYFASS